MIIGGETNKFNKTFFLRKFYFFDKLFYFKHNNTKYKDESNIFGCGWCDELKGIL
jgi:hypothetical protein